MTLRDITSMDTAETSYPFYLYLAPLYVTIFGWCFISAGNENLDGSVFCFLVKQQVQLCITSICQAVKPVAFYNTTGWFSTYVEQGREKNSIFLNL